MSNISNNMIKDFQSFVNESGNFAEDTGDTTFIYKAGDGTTIKVQSANCRYDKKYVIEVNSDLNNINSVIVFDSKADFEEFRRMIDKLK